MPPPTLASDDCPVLARHSHRALHKRQRYLRTAGLALLVVETCLIFAAFGELADRRPDARSGCTWCSKLNCAPLPWWDCTIYEVQTVPPLPENNDPVLGDNASQPENTTQAA
jgi:hypothetical protein